MTSLDEQPPAGGDLARPDVVCSAKGCRAEATWAIAWRNPRIHGLERRKAWSACADHRDFLADFLRVRSFLLDVSALR